MEKSSELQLSSQQLHALPYDNHNGSSRKIYNIAIDSDKNIVNPLKIIVRLIIQFDYSVFRRGFSEWSLPVHRPGVISVKYLDLLTKL